MKRIGVILAAIIVFSLASFGQEYRGVISGLVTDKTGAVIPGAKVIVTETNTGTKTEVSSEATGQYTVPFLAPGDYAISVQTTGFKTFERKGLHLGAGEHPTIDVQLEVGEVTQSVVVTADAPLINAENGSVGQAITTKEVEDLPSNGGTPMMLANLALGVIMTSQPNQVLPFASGGGAAWSIGGSPSQTNELSIDGAPNGTWDGRLAYSGLKDTVQEVRVKAFDTDAAYGHTGAGTINQVLKSGTNNLHGSLYENNQPSNLVANNFFNNKSGLPTQITHFNQYGLTAGGPLMLPKVLDGRNRVFWLFGFEGLKTSQPNTMFLSVPTEAERQGDFSALLKLKSPIVLYDPATGARIGTSTSNIARTAFPNNQIPQARFNSVAAKYLQYYPKPNITDPGLAGADGYNNFGNNATSIDGYTNELGRMDVNVSAKHRSYMNIRHTDYSQTKNNYYDNIASGSLLARTNWGIALDHVYMVSGSNVLNLRANFTRMFEDHRAPSAGLDPASIGFPSYLGANSQYLQLPYLSFATNTNFGALGMNGADRLPSQSVQLFGQWMATRGNHQLKFGGDIRQYRFNTAKFGNATGNFSFSNNNWVRACMGSSTTCPVSGGTSTTVTMGQDLAEFLLGLPTGGTYDINASAMYYSYYGALFVQDDWRVKRNLTVNIGVRFDHDFPWHEKWGRTVNGFDMSASSPLNAAAAAKYAASPSALLPASAFQVRGGLTFANPKDNAIFENTSHLLSPRFGFAWTPDKLGGKTVVRGGLGLFVGPVGISTLQVSGSYSTNPLALQTGFSQSTSLTSSNDNYLTPAATLSNPFPSGITQPAGSANGLLTFAGQSINFLNPRMKSPYATRWNFGFQQALARNMVLEVVYMGGHSVHVPMTYTQLNGVPRQYLSTLPVRDQNLINTLTATVPNPFQGLQTSIGTNTTVSTAQILAPFPQFPVASSNGATGSSGVVMHTNSAGSSYYNSLSVRLTKRLSHGLSITATGMKSKTIDRTTWLNDSDPAPEKRISPFDRPHRLVTAVIYELPFGRNKLIPLNAAWANTVLGGWKITSSHTFQAGAPLTWLNGSTNNPGDYVYFGAPLDSNPRNVDGKAFNTAAFDTNSANAFQYHLRTFSTTFPNLRADGINQWDVSVLKRVPLREKMYFELRGEAFNIINHPTFGAPNTTATNSAFGVINAQANRPRMVQLVARFVF